ncbi:MAG: chromosomal replication initiator protein DnaA [Pelagibacteraceae bacterium]|nr:chromosomal replication initiator protein DnaA [Pelagibacteraceae bacterium]
MAQDLNQISPIEINVKDLWHIVLKKLNNEFGNEIFNSWIKNIKVKSIDDDILYFSVPTRFIRDWITSHYLDKIIFFLNAENPNIRRVKISIDNMLSASHEKLEESSSETIKYQNRSSNLSQSDDWPLDERFTFDKFITGPSNELAFASAKRIAQSEKFDFNPLFLYGGVGLGKTHLMHAIAWEISNKNPNAKVLYLSAERFMFQFIKSLRQKDTMSFKQKFRSVDVLILDDIQFMVGKNSTQEEFFHTFNSLLDLNKKVILSSDRAPSDLEGFDERIKSRLSWGLVADILPASFELRYEILKKKSAELFKTNNNHHTLDDSVLIFLAKTIVSNVRELEGALNKVVTFSNIMNKKIDVELTKTVLKDLLRSNNKRITIDEIQNKVSNYYNINVDDLISSRRLRSFARPRQVAMYLSKKLTSRSLPEIGRKFGGRDHTTVIHAVKKIDQLKSENEKFDEDVSVLTQIITSS